MKTLHTIFPTKREVARQLAEDLVVWTSEKTKFNMAISGGSTPRVLFELLATAYLERIDWKKIHFYWVDERCVPPSHEDSNFRMTYNILLRNIPIGDLNVHRIRGEKEPIEEANRYGQFIDYSVPHHQGIPQFDLVMLGMGEDGHTASIFPDQIELLASKQICALARHPQSGQFRVTITGRVINNAKKVVFMVTGEDKAARIQEIFHRKGNWMFYPAAHIQPSSGDLTWYLDQAAASL